MKSFGLFFKLSISSYVALKNVKSTYLIKLRKLRKNRNEYLLVFMLREYLIHFCMICYI